jgi:hypothetical protein
MTYIFMYFNKYINTIVKLYNEPHQRRTGGCSETY